MSCAGEHTATTLSHQKHHSNGDCSVHKRTFKPQASRAQSVAQHAHNSAASITFSLALFSRHSLPYRIA